MQIRLARAQFDKTVLVSACLERLLAEHVPSAHQFALDDFRSQVCRVSPARHSAAVQALLRHRPSLGVCGCCMRESLQKCMM